MQLQKFYFQLEKQKLLIKFANIALNKDNIIQKNGYCFFQKFKL